MEASAVIPALMPQQIPLEVITPSKTNPKGRTSGPEFDELVASVRRNGVLVPILLRPDGDLYQVVAGSRRLAAARAAALTDIPAMVREMSEAVALELQLIENVHRADLHPLEEAEGYRRLMQLAKLDAAGVSERIGRPVAYVYDRVKLLDLAPAARTHFLEDRILLGHAIVLSRIPHADQLRAIREGLFTRQEAMWDPGTGDVPAEDKQKAVSVKELQAWVDSNCRFDTKRVDPMLYPQTALALEHAEVTGQKVVRVTYGHYTPDAIRDPSLKVYHSSSWKRADGEEKSKTCQFSVTGIVNAGPHRGDSFPVCVNKDKCTVHWADRARKSRATTAARSSSGGGGAVPREPKVNAKLQEALGKAIDDANRAIEGAVMAAAGQMSPERFLRAMALTIDSFSISGFAKQRQISVPAGEKLKPWVAKAPVRTVIELVAFELLENGYAETVAGAFGVDHKAIYKRHEDAARASSDPSLDVPHVKAKDDGAPRKRKTTSLKPKKAAKKAASKRSR